MLKWLKTAQAMKGGVQFSNEGKNGHSAPSHMNSTERRKRRLFRRVRAALQTAQLCEEEVFAIARESASSSERVNVCVNNPH